MLIDLRDEGKTRHIGVSNLDVDLSKRCMALGHVDSTQPPYDLLTAASNGTSSPTAATTASAPNVAPAEVDLDGVREGRRGSTRRMKHCWFGTLLNQGHRHAIRGG